MPVAITSKPRTHPFAPSANSGQALSSSKGASDTQASLKPLRSSPIYAVPNDIGNAGWVPERRIVSGHSGNGARSATRSILSRKDQNDTNRSAASDLFVAFRATLCSQFHTNDTCCSSPAVRSGPLPRTAPFNHEARLVLESCFVCANPQESSGTELAAASPHPPRERIPPPSKFHGSVPLEINVHPHRAPEVLRRAASTGKKDRPPRVA
jgi:hypothetical protein